MKLLIVERLNLLMLLPTEGSYSKLRLFRTLREELSFDEEEHKKFSIKDVDNKVMWNLQASVGYVKDVLLGEVMFDVLHKILQSLDKKEKLKDSQMGLYEKFVVETKNK